MTEYSNDLILIYKLFSAWAAVPMVHYTLNLGAAAQWNFLYHMIGGLLVYGAGFAGWQLRLPERFAPGTFDVFGMSHTW